MGREGKRKEGRERMGRDVAWKGKGDSRNGKDRSRHGMGWGGKGNEEGEGKVGEGLQPPNFNSWLPHCLNSCVTVVRFEFIILDFCFNCQDTGCVQSL